MLTIEATKSFAQALFKACPTFLPTQALYLDLEGGGGGSEEIMSLYWPYLPGAQRFHWVRRKITTEIGTDKVYDLLRLIGATSPRWVVVFSGGAVSPDERVRVVELLGEDPFPNSDWINLHQVFRDCAEIKRSVRENRHVWVQDRKNVMYSLESLEWEFGIVRPRRIRGHRNCFSDIDGQTGEMEVLKLTQRVREGLASEDEELSLKEYCEADVKNMYQIARTSERLVFSDAELRLRRRLYS